MKLFSIRARKLSWLSSWRWTVPYKAFSKYSYRSSSSVAPHDPPIASTKAAMPAWLFTFNFEASRRATLRNAVPSTRSAARGASWSRNSTGHMAARNLSFWVYSCTFVTPGENFGMLFHGNWGMPCEPSASAPAEGSVVALGGILQKYLDVVTKPHWKRKDV